LQGAHTTELQAINEGTIPTTRFSPRILHASSDTPPESLVSLDLTEPAAAESQAMDARTVVPVVEDDTEAGGSVRRSTIDDDSESLTRSLPGTFPTRIPETSETQRRPDTAPRQQLRIQAIVRGSANDTPAVPTTLSSEHTTGVPVADTTTRRRTHVPVVVRWYSPNMAFFKTLPSKKVINVKEDTTQFWLRGADHKMTGTFPLGHY
jgi:hypothetical protein